MKSPTLQNIADQVGVYPSTVSRVLRGDKKCFISKRKKELIQEYAKQINYRPNITARNLALKRTSNIAFVLCSFVHLENQGPFLTPIINGIQETAEKEGYVTSMVTVTYGSLTEMKNICSSRNLYGGILFGAGVIDPIVAKVIVESEMPAVFFGEDKTPLNTISCITTSKQKGVSEVIGYLKKLGHEKIAYFGNNPAMIDLYRNAIVSNHCVYAEDMIFLFPAHDIYCLALDAYMHADNLLANSSKFTAVFCSNDFVAMGLCERLKQKKMTLGKDISVVGFDDIEELFSVREEDRFLTTVHKPRKEMGREAFQMLLGIIKGESTEVAVRKLPCSIVVRKSAGEHI